MSLPEMSPWKRRPLTIPPDSWRAWVRLAVWECWMGMLVYGALAVGGAPHSSPLPTTSSPCSISRTAMPRHVVQPCERVAYQAGALSVAFNLWCGLLLMAVAVWLLWELWNAVAPKPITDDFLKLLDDSFGRDWRKPRTWPWSRLLWAYGFTAGGRHVGRLHRCC